MRRLGIPLGIALLVAMMAAVPVSASGGLRPVKLNVNSSFDTPQGSFTAQGPVCASGMTTDDVQVIDTGVRLFFDDLKTFTCADGSGTFTLHILATVKPCQPLDHGAWAAVGGTGRYAHLQGAGTDVGRYFPGDSCNADGIIDIFTGVMTR